MQRSDDVSASSFCVERDRRRRADVVGGVEAGCFEVHFQPLLPLLPRGGTTFFQQVEVLARRVSPDHGVYLPDVFLPEIERAGELGAMTFRILRLSLQQLHAWDSEGLVIDIAVKVAPELVATHGFVERVLGELDAAGIDYPRLTLELTEHRPAVCGQVMHDNLRNLRAHGVRVSIDDFGSGYSSLLRLFELPFSELKIERELIRSLSSSEKARTIVAWTIGLAHSLGLRVCAEGVESSEQLAFLAGQDCDFAQGYFISRPLPAHALRTFALHGKEATL